jgi:O-methyltransferase involved in polyketide biosynthesis
LLEVCGPAVRPGGRLVLRCNGLMSDNHRAELGDVQQTLFIPLAARARQLSKKRPILRDPRAAELIEAIDFDQAKYGQGAGGGVVVLRTMIFDWWVREFLAGHPAGTVVELGTGLNTRFERVDNGQVHWIDLDLPDTIDLRRKFFTDAPRRQMISGSVLDGDWLQAVSQLDGPYFFITEGVLVYLPEDQVLAALARLAAQFPGELIALDTYSRKAFEAQHRMAARRNIAPWAWACDDPGALERLGWQMVETVRVTRPPARIRAQLPARYRYLLPLADPFFGQALRLTLFRANPR